MLQKRLEGVGQDLVGAVPDEYLLGCNVIAGRDRFAQVGRARIGVEAQPFCSGCDRRQDARRGLERVLVGVELDDAFLLWLLAWDVRRQHVDDGIPEAAHNLRSKGGSQHSRVCGARAEVRHPRKRQHAIYDGSLGQRAAGVSRRPVFPAPLGTPGGRDEAHGSGKTGRENARSRLARRRCGFSPAMDALRKDLSGSGRAPLLGARPWFRQKEVGPVSARPQDEKDLKQ